MQRGELCLGCPNQRGELRQWELPGRHPDGLCAVRLWCDRLRDGVRDRRGLRDRRLLRRPGAVRAPARGGRGVQRQRRLRFRGVPGRLLLLDQLRKRGVRRYRLRLEHGCLRLPDEPMQRPDLHGRHPDQCGRLFHGPLRLGGGHAVRPVRLRRRHRGLLDELHGSGGLRGRRLLLRRSSASTRRPTTATAGAAASSARRFRPRRLQVAAPASAW